MPSIPGSYRFVARDLVGNTSAALVKVPDAAPGDATVASSIKFTAYEAAEAE